ncbi:hypothetical protein SAMN05216249_11654 [Acetitomaculum ruminis DSM 5522]|uniref:Uncharacterized protein n=1 Tax=Acetitomaculum ruminis DSM 5522 TaxID=1120918 RepID=A0A1I0ZRW2_9FIRM|nr:DUF5688 family protein [Acetitomaculum ruminis]SFB27180.1 hypothetical protein SAMN05216249_11654 [Acetitomaculum ruminis DSM 5522]
MDYEEFLDMFSFWFEESPIYEQRHYEYKIFTDGYKGQNEQERKMIRNHNSVCNKSDSDTMIGDIFFVDLGEVSESVKIMLKFDLELLFEAYEIDGWDLVWKVVGELIDERFAKTEESKVPKLIRESYDYDRIKDYLKLSMVNYDDNKNKLSNVIYKRIGDMAIVLYMCEYLPELEMDMKYSLSEEYMKFWKLSKDEIFHAALLNTYMNALPRMYTDSEYHLMCIDDSPRRYDQGAYMSIGSEITFDKEENYRFTTVNQEYGAISFFYPGIQEKLMEFAGGDFYVVFADEYEFRIYPVDGPKKLDEIKKVIENRYEEELDEVLSRKIYRFDSKEKMLYEVEE